MIDYEQLWQHAEKLPWCTLVGIGRAGSDAFHSQLDSHPQIMTFNGYLFFHDFWHQARTTQSVVQSDKDFWTSPAAAEHRLKLDAADIADEFIGYFIWKLRTKYDFVERKNQLGDNMDQSITVDLAQFKDHIVKLFAHREINSRNYLTAVYIAYTLTMGQDVFQKKVIFHHIHNVRRTPRYFADFPDSKIIATNRDPRAAYVSGVEHRRAFHPDVNTPWLAWHEIERLMDETIPLFAQGDRFCAIRLEDYSNEAVMAEVCRWLGVDFDPVVMRSTWNGLRWWGDRHSQAKATPGMDEAQFLKNIRTNNWETKLSKLERYVLEFILGPRLDQCRYVKIARNYALHAIGTFLAIPLLMTYERAFFSPLYWLRCLVQLKFRELARVPYHYVLRVKYYYKLYFRTLRGQWLKLPVFGAAASQSMKSAA